MNFKKYKRKGLSEMVSVTEFTENGGDLSKVSISSPDHLLQNHHPNEFNLGYVARNPKNHEDLWYVSNDYFEANLEPAEEQEETSFIERLVKEKTDLSEKLNKLSVAISSDNFEQKVGAVQFKLLVDQFGAMSEYYVILQKRYLDLCKQA